MAKVFAGNEESSGAEWILMRHANREIVKPSDTLFPTVAGNLTDSQVESFLKLLLGVATGVLDQLVDACTLCTFRIPSGGAQAGAR